MTEPSARAPLERWLVALAAIQARKPWVTLVVAGLFALGAGALASRLQLRTRFDQLLPESQPSVLELHRIFARTSNASKVFVVLEGESPATVRALGDALVPELESLGAPAAAHVADGVQKARAFLLPRAGLFADLGALKKLDDDLQARWDYEMAKSIGADFDDDEPPKEIDADEIRRRFLAGSASSDDRFPDGYFQSPDGKKLVVVVQSTIQGGDLDGSRAALAKIQEATARVAKRPEFAAVAVGYAGDLVTGLHEYGAVKQDLVSVGILGVAMVLGVVFLFYMRVRAVFAMGVTVLVGLAWTFGVTQLAIGHLNVATGFLFSIVAGNGLNFAVIYMARYFEERRHGADPAAAVSTAHVGTYRATLTASLAAAGSYASLGVTDFRGFKHFALIGAAGMLLCWLATVLVTPPLLVLFERVRPFTATQPTSLLGRMRLGGSRYDLPFVFLVRRAPRAAAALGVVLALVGGVLLVRWVRADPMEYDMRKLQNDLGTSGELYRVSALARQVLGVTTESGMVVLVDDHAQVAPLRKALLAKRDTPQGPAFEALHSLDDYVAQDQAAKIPTLLAIRHKIVRAHANGSLDEAQWKKVQPYLPPAELQPFTLFDLPDDLAAPFTESDGTKGRIVFVEPTAGQNDNDLHYLLRWAASFRESRLDDGSVIHGSGRAVIFADMLESVLHDIPKSIGLSLAMTFVAVLLVFRASVQSALVALALAAGVFWLGGLLDIVHARINFLNFIALPITFGIGADYAVNIVHRAKLEGAVKAIERTGGAVVLCSLTTILGYLALLGSINQAVRGLGLVAVLGEFCCLAAAMLVLPGVMLSRFATRIGK